MAARTCSYLLGNKGCHSYNGNPRNDFKDELSLDEKTMKIIEGRIHESVGHILNKYDDTTGTGFRVGRNYFMSAYHVFRVLIHEMLDQIVIFMPQTVKDDVKGTIDKLRKYLDSKTTSEEKDFDEKMKHIMREFLNEHGTDVQLLLDRLHWLIPPERMDALKDSFSRKWRENCTVEFSGEKQFFVHWNIMFGDKEHDVIIVELKNENAQEVPFPPPLLIDDRHRPEENIQIIQYKIDGIETENTEKKPDNQVEWKINVSTKCELFHSSEFSESRNKCIGWWSKWGNKTEFIQKGTTINFKSEFEKDCPTEYDETTGLLITQASRSFKEGSSGSPMMYLSRSVGLPVVTSVFQGGLPSFYYKDAKDGGKFLRDDKSDDICGEYLFEKGRSMEKVADLLDRFRKTDLRENIFNPLKLVQEKFSNCYGRREPNDFMKRTVEAWQREDDTCYATKGVKATMDKILTNNCVCVTGDPGSGKSMSIRHAALCLMKKDDFTVYPISSPDDFFKYLDTKKSQVFVIDDILGIHSVYKDLMNSWSKHHDVIKSLLSNQTKMLASLRTHLVQHQNVRLEDFVFLEKSKRVDLYHNMYRLDNDEMSNMLRKQLNAYSVENADEIISKIWGDSQYDEQDLQNINCFPLLCKMFCKDQKFRMDPKTFFLDPFPALIKTFRNMKHENRPLFCGLLLCVAFDGTLSGENLSTFAEFTGELDDKIITLRDHLVRSLRLDPRSDLDSIKSALSAVNGVYVTRIGNDYEISHRIFHDIVTYVYDDKLFIFKFGTSQFIKDRVRVKKRKGDDQFVVVCAGDRNIQRLTTRLTEDFKCDIQTLMDDNKSDSNTVKRPNRMTDLKRDPSMGASFIVENPNIDDEKIIDCLRDANLDKKAVYILFRECFFVIQENEKKLKQKGQGDVRIPQLKLIELLIELGADCNMTIGFEFPLSISVKALHISIRSCSLQLTRLLLEKGADMRICDRQCRSVLHMACSAEYNTLPLVSLFIEKGVDQVPAVRILGVGKRQILNWLELSRERNLLLTESLPTGNGKMQKLQIQDDLAIQLEEVNLNGLNKVITNNSEEVRKIIDTYEGNGTLQLVEILHESCLNSVNAQDGQNVLHIAVRKTEACVVEKLLGLGPKLTCKGIPDDQGKTAEDLLDGDERIKDRREKRSLFEACC